MTAKPPSIRRWVLPAVAAIALLAPTAAGAHDVSTASGHAAEDSVVHTQATETQMNQLTTAVSAAESQAATVAGTADQVGQWGPVEDWPVVGIHVALLPNGKVLAYDSVGDLSYTKYTDHTFTRATVYDPATGTQTPAWVSGYNVFCSGLAHLTDGSLFVAGGNADAASNGIVQTHVFDYNTNSWTRTADMAYARWYPTVTPLTNGEMLISSGRPLIPEVRGTDGALRTLDGASLSLPLYPWMDVAPDGRVFYSGPDDNLRELDPSGGGTWQSFGGRDGLNRDYGSHAVYDVGKILVAGGGPSLRDARTIDIKGATPQVSATSPMAFGRRQHNLTVLADGTVLATGGNSTGAPQIDMNGGVYPAELWNPSTGGWTTLAAMQVTRQYHSTALLLPDGRVLSSGGGICDTCDDVGYLAKNAEIFSPPYLFSKDGSGQLAPRPVVSAAPGALPYGTSFEITTPNAASIAKIGLVRLGAVTHSVNMEQRYVPLSFTKASGSLTATIPGNANVAPPGYYMLFIVNDAGVPSVAHMLRLDPTASPPPPPPPPPNQPPTVSLTSPANGATFAQPAKIDLAATASDPDGSVTKVGFYDGSKLIGEDTTAPYTWRWNVSVLGSHVLTARATDNAGATTTSSQVTITVVKKR